MFFESHAHYDDERFNRDREALLESFPAAGIDYVVNAGIDLRSTEYGIALSEKYDFFYCAAGVHPHEAKTLDEEGFKELVQLAQFSKVVAIGEIGLDFHYDNSPRNTQRYWFKRQLELAEQLEKPVIIHSREAAAECFNMIKSSNIRRGVIHCYSGSVEMAMDYIKMGFYIGIGGVVTYKNAKTLKEVARQIPLDKLVLETDCPYLSPEPVRGKRNDSKNLIYIAEEISRIRQTKEEKRKRA